jgi:hypothetical protein
VYLAAENRIVKAQIKGLLLLSKEAKARLAEIAHRLGRKVKTNTNRPRVEGPFLCTVLVQIRDNRYNRSFWETEGRSARSENKAKSIGN